jgi:SagB-type dehydrogenase family enzyme
VSRVVSSDARSSATGVASGIAAVHRYHDGTKHHFTRFARSLGYLDWASQPKPFRSFAGAATTSLVRDPSAIAGVLRHALGLSAWKQFRESRPSTRPGTRELVERRWPLRANPSSGNLHPTEAYVFGQVAGAAVGVWHYAPDRHALEQRCAVAASARNDAGRDPSACLVALTSIHWREAWKYGERAFRYCQHDLGHAIAALRIAAALYGLQATVLPEWSHADIAALTGIDRDEDYVDAEREEPGCVLLVGAAPAAWDRRGVLAAVREGQWTGQASQLSEDHVAWTFIDEVAGATRDPGRAPTAGGTPLAVAAPPAYPAPLLLQRRSAVALDGVSSIEAARFFDMLSRVVPTGGLPWDGLWWDARIHFVLFVHRVDGVEPGLYLLVRSEAAFDRLRAACGRDFLWTRAHAALPLYLLARGDCRAVARRLSCDQEIAADGFFSLGMLADFDRSLEEGGPSFYRHLFWESGFVGQVLYLEAEAVGARATGIGCFYDDPVHDLLGIGDHAFQSLYHFTIGMPVEDTRLTTEPGYDWEDSGPRSG